MSNEVKTKEKVNMDPKYIIKLTVTLLLTCMVVAGLLGWVNSITKDKIAAITWEKTVAAMQKVIEADDFSDAMELTDDMTAAATAQGGTLAAVYQVLLHLVGIRKRFRLSAHVDEQLVTVHPVVQAGELFDYFVLYFVYCLHRHIAFIRCKLTVAWSGPRPRACCGRCWPAYRSPCAT